MYTILHVIARSYKRRSNPVFITSLRQLLDCAAQLETAGGTIISTCALCKLFKISLLIMLLLQMLSCTPSAPYEIKSPCVSIESPEMVGMNPCVRRPANRDLI